MFIDRALESSLILSTMAVKNFQNNNSKWRTLLLDELVFSPTKDLKIVCSDQTVNSHQTLFSWISSFLRRFFLSKQIMEDSGKLKDEVTIFLPEISSETLNLVISIFSRGEAIIPSKSTSREVSELWGLLRIDRIEFGSLKREELEPNTSQSVAMPEVIDIIDDCEDISNNELDTPIVKMETVNDKSEIKQENLLKGSQTSETPTSKAKPDSAIGKNETCRRDEPEKSKNGGLATESEGRDILSKSSSSRRKVESREKNNLTDKKSPTTHSGQLKSFPNIILSKFPGTLPANSNQTETSRTEFVKERNTVLSSSKISITKSISTKCLPSSLKKPKKAKVTAEKDLEKVVISDSSPGSQSPNRTSEAQVNINLQETETEEPASQTAAIVVPGYDNVEIKDEGDTSTKTDFSLSQREIEDLMAEVGEVEDSTKKRKNDVDDQIDQGTALSTGRLIKRRRSSRLKTPVSPLQSCIICGSDRDGEGGKFSKENIYHFKNHLAQCFYSSGRLFTVIEPGEDNRDKSGKPLNESSFESSMKYKCPVPGCFLPQEDGGVGYKTFALHVATEHGVLEELIKEDGTGEARQLLEWLGYKSSGRKVDFSRWSQSRIEKKEQLKDKGRPRPAVSRKKQESYGLNDLHDCLICGGARGGGSGLSLRDFSSLKDHYSKCFYSENIYHKFLSPGEGNTREDGSPLDCGALLYRCRLKGCPLNIKSGVRGLLSYRDYSLHMSRDHGILEKVMENDSRPQMSQILEGLKKLDQYKPEIIRCRFAGCEEIFNGDSKRQLKLHYATEHFQKYFPVDQDSGLSPGFSKADSKCKCVKCEETGKTILIVAGLAETIRHLVITHDELKTILKDNIKESPEIIEIFRDIYQQ